MTEHVCNPSKSQIQQQQRTSTTTNTPSNATAGVNNANTKNSTNIVIIELCSRNPSNNKPS